MNGKLYQFVKTCKQSQSFLWEKDRLSQTQKRKIVLYKKKKNTSTKIRICEPITCKTANIVHLWEII